MCPDLKKQDTKTPAAIFSPGGRCFLYFYVIFSVCLSTACCTVFDSVVFLQAGLFPEEISIDRLLRLVRILTAEL